FEGSHRGDGHTVIAGAVGGAKRAGRWGGGGGGRGFAVGLRCRGEEVTGVRRGGPGRAGGGSGCWAATRLGDSSADDHQNYGQKTHGLATREMARLGFRAVFSPIVR